MSLVGVYIYICHYCNKPTYISDDEQIPGVLPGSSVDNINDAEVDALYTEARKCFSMDAFTACVMCCRKLLMNIAVSKGAKEGLNFTDYVEYIADNGYVPPDCKQWVEKIRKKGNEAAHKINIMSKEDAQDLIYFLGMLLKFIYEFPALYSKEEKADT